MGRIAFKADYFRDDLQLLAPIIQNVQIHAAADRRQITLEVNQRPRGSDVFSLTFRNHVHAVIRVPLGTHGKRVDVARSGSVISYLALGHSSFSSCLASRRTGRLPRMIQGNRLTCRRLFAVQPLSPGERGRG
jgi:hypothetical protein